jgi:acyl carrier protein
MVPSAFVALRALPLTANGKVDRAALPAPDRSRADLGAEMVPPRSALEEIVAGIWAEVLGLERIGVRDDFFELGGHSLLATQVVSRIQDSFAVELPLRSLFERPTVEGLCGRLTQLAGDQARLERVAQVMQRLAQLSEEEVGAMLAARTAGAGAEDR